VGPVPKGNVDSLTLVERLVAHGANINARLTKPPHTIYTGRNALNYVGGTRSSWLHTASTSI